MNVREIAEPFIRQANLIKGCNVVLDHLNLNNTPGDFGVVESTAGEFTLMNHSACPSFSQSRKKCDIKACELRLKEVNKGLSFIDKDISASLLSCANLNDGQCIFKVTMRPLST